MPILPYALLGTSFLAYILGIASRQFKKDDDYIMMKGLFMASMIFAAVSIGVSLQKKSSITVKDIIQTSATYLAIIGFGLIGIMSEHPNFYGLTAVSASIILSAFSIDTN